MTSKFLKAVFVIIIAFVFIMLSVTATASFGEEETEYLKGVEDDLNNALNEDAREYFEKEDISITENVTQKLTFEQIIKEFLHTLSGGIKGSVSLFATLLAVVVICAMTDSMYSKNNEISSVLELVGVMAVIGVLFSRIISTIDYISVTINDIGKFMLTYVPVFASIIGGVGSVISATSYYVTLIAIAEISSLVAMNILVPVLSILLALSIIGSINTALSFSAVIDSVRKAFLWVVGLIMTIFVGSITIQGIVGVSADTVTTKAAKFMLSSFVPVVGGAISEAYSTVKGSLGLIRSCVGSFGIVAVLSMIIPPLVNILTVKLAIALASIISDTLGVNRVSSILKSSATVLTLSMALLLCMGLMLIISTTVMMLVCINL